MYKVQYLPIARQDMVEIARYIGQTLQNPIAAMQIAEEMVAAGEGLSNMPYANPAYLPIRPLAHEYRKLLVHNYLMLYWVDEVEKTVTIARVVYARRDYEKLLP